jgi:hypothetical protein
VIGDKIDFMTESRKRLESSKDTERHSSWFKKTVVGPPPRSSLFTDQQDRGSRLMEKLLSEKAFVILSPVIHSFGACIPRGIMRFRHDNTTR